MALDVRQLRPSQLARLLNSTPLGEVVQPHTVYRQRMRAGFRIGEGDRIDLVRYVAWLVVARQAAKPDEESSLKGYEAMKESARARNAALSASGRDIGDLPAVEHPRRKKKAVKSFERFCKAYFPQVFHLPWSRDHLKAISLIEDAVMRGGLSGYFAK